MSVLVLLVLGSCGGPWHASAPPRPVALAVVVDEDESGVDGIAGSDFLHVLHGGPPGDVVTLPGEYEPVEGIILGWARDAWLHFDTFADMAVESSKRTRVTILHERDEESVMLAHELSQRGALMQNVEVVNASLDTMWIRDYGPLVVRTRAGGKRIIDFPYARSRDDRVPSIVASAKRISLSFVPLDLEGGHIQSDGTGRCIVSEDVIFRNDELGRTELEVRQLLKDFLGCTTTAIVPYLDGEETGHVDIFVYVFGPGKVLLGEYERWEDRENHDRLEQTRVILERAGFSVTRIPMPRNDARAVFRSYTNVVVLDDAVFVPTYAKARRRERAALRVLGRVFPGREIVPMRADALADLGGALHCISMTIAR